MHKNRVIENTDDKLMSKQIKYTNNEESKMQKYVLRKLTLFQLQHQYTVCHQCSSMNPLTPTVAIQVQL